jgi:hypothetical protein
MKTTLNKIRSHSPCHDGWSRLLSGLGKTAADDEVIWIDQILDHNGLDDALWCLRAVDGCDREIRLYAVWCARRVQHLMVDARSVAALDVAERYARNEASAEELAAARGLAAAAESAAYVAAQEAWAAAYVAAQEAWAAAESAAHVAAQEAWAAAAAYAGAATSDTERAAQAEELRRICREMRESGR